MGDQCYQEGLRVGEAVARSLRRTRRRRGKCFRCGDERIRLTAPANVALIGKTQHGHDQYAGGAGGVRFGGGARWARKCCIANASRCPPERRILLRISLCRPTASVTRCTSASNPPGERRLRLASNAPKPVVFGQLTPRVRREAVTLT
ncbi:hypothetical protein M8494_10170 [Serratia ureilytica]